MSDGAKLSTRKRGMLNSALVTWKGVVHMPLSLHPAPSPIPCVIPSTAGVIFLQQTDGTGNTKDGEFLRDDYISAIEKAGPVTVVRKMTDLCDVGYVPASNLTVSNC